LRSERQPAYAATASPSARPAQPGRLPSRSLKAVPGRTVSRTHTVVVGMQQRIEQQCVTLVRNSLRGTGNG
jgi:hypothetical protein